MNEQIVQMAPMWILAGVGAGWLADMSMVRRGYGLIVDRGIGVGAAVVGGTVFHALYGASAGMVVMSVSASSRRPARSSASGSVGLARQARGIAGRGFASWTSGPLLFQGRGQRRDYPRDVTSRHAGPCRLGPGRLRVWRPPESTYCAAYPSSSSGPRALAP
jgi:hypothetical protein